MFKNSILYGLFLINICFIAQAADNSRRGKIQQIQVVDDHNVAYTLRECLSRKLIKNDNESLQAFLTYLQAQEQFMASTAQCTSLYTQLKNKVVNKNRENEILKKLNGKFIADSQAHRQAMVHLTTEKAINWSIRFNNHIRTLALSDSETHIKQANNIINKWCDDPDEEIRILTELYSLQLKNNALRKEMTANAKCLGEATSGFFSKMPENDTCLNQTPMMYGLKHALLIGNALMEPIKDIDTVPKKIVDIFAQIATVLQSYERSKAKIESLIQAIDQKLNPPAVSQKDQNDFLPAHLKQKAPSKKQKSSAPQPKKSKSRGKKQRSLINKNNIIETIVTGQPTLTEPDAVPEEVIEQTIYAYTYPVIEENDLHVKIEDNLNDVHITLWKTHEPQQEHSNPKYTSWVTDWFTDPANTLKKQGYNNPSNSKYNLKDTAQLVHAFSQEADNYLTTCGVKVDVVNNKGNKHIAVVMPGSIEKAGKTQYGLFQYFIDPNNGQWYHRNFVPKDIMNIYREYTCEGIYKVMYPELPEA